MPGMPAGYGQFCPIAKASEIFASRWTPLMLRELMAGMRSFTAIAGWVCDVAPDMLERLYALYRAKSSVEGRELHFRGCGQAARRYSLMTPPRTRRRRTGASIATTTPGSWSGGC